VILVDTNILLYMYEPLDPAKQARAIAVNNHLREHGNGCLSAQVLAEFCHASIRKLRLDKAFVLDQVTLFAASWPTFDLTSAIVLEAARGVRDHSLAYYDAQIWATAKLHRIPVLFSEDFNSGSSLEGVAFVNPFAPAFVLENWI
jgi:predicted nucleic acid-binding protein